MASLDILCSDPHNILKEITLKKHMRNFLTANEKFSKTFHGPSIYP